MKKLEGKVAIITGASGGIGEGIARVFAGYGARLVLAGRSEKVLDIAEELREDNYEAVGVRADVTVPADVKKIVDTAIGYFGTIDILVGNAGVMDTESFLVISDEVRDELWNINVNGVWNMAKAVLPYMIEKQQGKIVIVSSVTGYMVANPNRVAYSASKAALIGMTRSLASEMARYHINVNAVCPGTIHTPMIEKIAEVRRPEDPEGELYDMGAGIPWKRLGRPEDVGELAAFLSSGESDYITGTQIVIDGGNSLPE